MTDDNPYAARCREVHRGLATPPPPLHEIGACPACNISVCLPHHQCRRAA